MQTTLQKSPFYDVNTLRNCYSTISLIRSDKKHLIFVRDDRIYFIKHVLNLWLPFNSNINYSDITHIISYNFLYNINEMRIKDKIFRHHRSIIHHSHFHMFIMSQYNNVQVRKAPLRWNIYFTATSCFVGAFLHHHSYIFLIHAWQFSFKAALSSSFDVCCKPGATISLIIEMSSLIITRKGARHADSMDESYPLSQLSVL